MEGKFGHDVGHMGTLQPFAFPEDFWSQQRRQERQLQALWASQWSLVLALLPAVTSVAENMTPPPHLS